MNLSERKKLALARDELLHAKEEIETGNKFAGKMHVLSAICFIDMIYTIQRSELSDSAEPVGQG